jgi:hypothetical protein
MKTGWLNLWLLVTSVLLLSSCGILKPNVISEGNSPKYLMAGESAPFDGWLVSSEEFTILLQEAGR